MPPIFNVKAYYQNLARTFRGGPSVPHQVANKTAGPGEFVGTPIGTAAAYLRSSTNQFASHMAHYGNYSRLSRYADYSEMETMAEVASALDIYSHEVCAKGEYGEILKIESNNPAIKDALLKLFYDTLNIEFNLAPWVRSLCKYGDYMLLVDHHPDFGVVNVFPMPVNEVEREEGFDVENPMRYRYRWISHNNKILEPWQVIHFRMLGNDSYLPYGMSILEAARRAWRQLILMEDAVMVYRIVRSPERRVFYIDVGNVAPEDVGQVMEKTKNNMKRNQVVDPSSGQVDLRYNALPVHWATPIPLLDGRTLTIADLAEEYRQGKQNWVYSIQDETRNMVPGKVVWCGKNYRAKKLVEVTLDDMTKIVTAPEHPFVLRNGSSLRADQLKAGIPLMPMTRHVNDHGYELVYDASSKRYTTTHKLVARSVFKGVYNPQRDVIHHIGHWKGPQNKRNNAPENLRCMTRVDHSRLHIEHAQNVLLTPENIERCRQRFLAYNKTEEHRQRTIETNQKYNKARKMGDAYNNSALHIEHNKIRRKAQQKSWADPDTKKKRSETMRWVFPDEALVLAQQIYQQNPNIDYRGFIKKFRDNDDVKKVMAEVNSHHKRDISRISEIPMRQWLIDKGYSGFNSFREQSLASEHYTNHKVLSVKLMEADDDVYCMTVIGPQGEDDRHNFAACGIDQQGNVSRSAVVVRNSVDEDFYIGVRGQDTGTRIDTLPGGSYPVRKDSLIPLFDGRVITIEELAAEYESGKENWVQSVQDTTHKSVPGKVIWCGKNYHCKDIHRVHLMNGYWLDFAPEHPLILSDGSSIKAHQLIGREELMTFGPNKSHVVSSIEVLQNVSDDVYCMTVVGPEGQHDRHNFAMLGKNAAGGYDALDGIYVKNTGDIEDLHYIQNKLFAALKIPKSYLGYEGDLSGKSTLAQEDVRFARTIQHIQRIVIAELEKIAMLHLYSMGFRDEDMTDFELSMANPSTINEIQRLELWRTRFEVASLATGQDGVLDKTFIYRHIFKLSDQDIENIETGRLRDMQFQVELNSLQPTGDGAIQEPVPDSGDVDYAATTDGPMGTGSIDAVGESNDPNQQRAAPNDMLGRAKKKKKSRASVVKQVYGMKKNGMDPLKDLQLMRRAGTSPWAEGNEQKSDGIFEKRLGLLGRHSELIKSLEHFKVPSKKKIL